MSTTHIDRFAHTISPIGRPRLINEVDQRSDPDYEMRQKIA